MFSLSPAKRTRPLCGLQSYLVSVELSRLEPYPPCDDIDAEPMMDDRLGRGVDVSWTSDGRGGGRRGSPAQVPPRLVR